MRDRSLYRIYNLYRCTCLSSLASTIVLQWRELFFIFCRFVRHCLGNLFPGLCFHSEPIVSESQGKEGLEFCVWLEPVSTRWATANISGRDLSEAWLITHLMSLRSLELLAVSRHTVNTLHDCMRGYNNWTLQLIWKTLLLLYLSDRSCSWNPFQTTLQFTANTYKMRALVTAFRFLWRNARRGGSHPCVFWHTT